MAALYDSVATRLVHGPEPQCDSPPGGEDSYLAATEYGVVVRQDLRWCAALEEKQL